MRWEGPAIYETTIEVPQGNWWLVFHGVSYSAKVFLDGELAYEHHGIWDAFSVPLPRTSTPHPPPPPGQEEGEASRVALRVEVTKNGGATYPVRDVASGFLPFVFNTFGGIYKEVELIESVEDPMLRIWGQSSSQPSPSSPSSPSHSLTLSSPPPCRVTVKGTKIFVDGKPFYLRAPLTWGWYPEFGHTNPDEETVRKEVRQMKSMGFNTVKFCLWVPHHRYFEILEAEGMFAWLELPLWDPTPDPEKQEAMFEELRRIVLEYRRHSNIIVWTCGCELSSNTSAEYRERLYKMVKELTGAALVKDNSGGSEMYGGDLREFGDFYDFHPYCDLPFYPLVLDSLLVGPRKKMPILLGEFNDYDVHRDLARLKRERPYWTSQDPYLNDQGARWQHDLPGILDTCRWAEESVGDPLDFGGRTKHEVLMFNSLWRSVFIRHRVQEAVRSKSDIAGYVITSWRETPIASSAMVDDWGEPRKEFHLWNSEDALFLIPDRRPPWKCGGNRAGWTDPLSHFVGPVHVRIGLHSPMPFQGVVKWRAAYRPSEGENVVREAGEWSGVLVEANESTEAGSLVLQAPWPGRIDLNVVWGNRIAASWELEVFGKPNFGSHSTWGIVDGLGLLESVELLGEPNLICTHWHSEFLELLGQGSNCVLLLTQKLTAPMPFWREAIEEFHLLKRGLAEALPLPPLPNSRDLEGVKRFRGKMHEWQSGTFGPLKWLAGNTSALLAVSPDRVIDLDALQEAVGKLEDLEILINRIDTRTYREDPILIRAKVGKGTLVATTLRPYGGLGIQPVGVMNNPAGAALLESLIKLAEER